MNRQGKRTEKKVFSLTDDTVLTIENLRQCFETEDGKIPTKSQIVEEAIVHLAAFIKEKHQQDCKDPSNCEVCSVN